MLNGLLGYLTETNQTQGSLLDSLVSMESEDHSSLQHLAVQVVKALKVEEAAKFASVVLLKRYENIKKLEKVFQCDSNALSFAYHFAKAVFDEIGYPLKIEDSLKVLDMIDIMVTEGEAYDVEGSLDNTVIGRKLKGMLNGDIPKPALLILFPFYRSFIKQAPNIDEAKRLFRKAIFDRFFHDVLLASPNEGRFTIQQKLRLIDNLNPDDVFSSLTHKLDKCKLENQVEMSEKSISVVQGIFEKYQLKARIKHEISPLKTRITALTEIFSKLEDSRYRVATENLNSLLKTLVEELYKGGMMSEEQVKAQLEKCNLEVSKIMTAIINEPVDGVTPLHRLVMRSFSAGSEAQIQKKNLQRELECLLREGASLELSTTNYEISGSVLIGLMRALGSAKKEPLNVVQLAKRYGNSAILSQAMEAIETEKKPLETLEVPSPTLEWQRGAKRDRRHRTPPPTPEASPRTTLEGEENKKKTRKG